MNDKLQDALTDLIKNSTDFVNGQAPDVLQQLLNWETHKLIGYLCVESVVLVVCGWALFRGFRWASSPKGDAEAFFPLTALAVIALIVGVVFPICDAFSLAKVQSAPKVWLLEYAAHFVGK